MHRWLGRIGGIVLPTVVACGPSVATTPADEGGAADSSSTTEDPTVGGVTLGTTAGTTASPTASDSSDPSDPSDTASTGEVPDSCGDTIVDEGEECDDGNGDANDGCESDCRFSPGTILWSHSIDGGAGLPDMGSDVVVDSAGTIYAVGGLQNTGTLDAWLGVFAPDGTSMSDSSLDLGEDEIANSVVLDTSGAVFIAAQAVDSGTALVLRSEDGGLEQIEDEGPQDSPFPTRAAASPTGGFFTLRQAWENDPENPGWAYDITARDAVGGAIWTSSDFPGALVLSIVGTPDGGVVIAGQIENAASHGQVWLRELDSEGTEVWTYDEDFVDYDDEAVHTVIFTGDGRLLAAGRQEIPGFGFVPFVAELDRSGALVDLRDVSVGDASFWLYALVDDPNGLVVGGAAYPVNTPSNAVIAALDDDGVVRWGTSYDDALGFNDSVRALARDPTTGDLIAIGTDVGEGQGDNLWIARIRG